MCYQTMTSLHHGGHQCVLPVDTYMPTSIYISVRYAATRAHIGEDRGAPGKTGISHACIHTARQNKCCGSTSKATLASVRPDVHKQGEGVVHPCA